MYCPNCGTYLSDYSNFCSKCGQKINPEKAAAEEKISEEIKKESVQTSPAKANPIISTLKKTGASPLFLIATIFYTVAALFRFFNFITLNPILSISDSFDLLSNLGILTCNLLVVVGLWLTFGLSAKKNDCFNTVGLSMIKVVQRIIVVFVITIGAFFATLLLASAIDLNLLDQYQRRNFSILISFVIPAAVVFFSLFHARIAGSVDVIKEYATKGTSKDVISGLAGVMFFISAVLYPFAGDILTQIYNLFNFGIISDLRDPFWSLLGLMNDIFMINNFLSGAVIILESVSFILFGIIIFIAKAKIKRTLKNN